MIGARIHEERIKRGWTLRIVAEKAGLSVGATQAIEAGTAGSLDAHVRLADALGLRLALDLVDPRRKQSAMRQADLVHGAMGEFEVAQLRRLSFPVGVDEPYQHYQFAGRADVVSWDIGADALLHIENRTRFPDVQEAAGSFNAKRSYLGPILADRFGIPGWASETHVIVALWSAEVLHALRQHEQTFRALAGADPRPFEGWWAGSPPARGRHSTLIVLDPLAVGRQRTWIGLEDALNARPRHRGYAEIARLLTGVA